jgi:3-deoxy-D-manno-octulosonate 8-phosphate phosphatase (KDO 8-P phosphatase)
MPKTPKLILEKAQKIKLLLLDVDGVLTDGSVFYDEKGREIKRFFVQDGQGIRWLQKSGIDVGFLSGRSSQAVTKRAEELGIRFCFQGIRNKMEVFEKVLRQTALQPEEVSFMGDDFIDVPLMKRVGFPISVMNGHPLVQREAVHIPNAIGGRGAVREVCELILRAQNKWDPLLREYGLSL